MEIDWCKGNLTIDNNQIINLIEGVLIDFHNYVIEKTPIKIQSFSSTEISKILSYAYYYETNENFVKVLYMIDKFCFMTNKLHYTTDTEKKNVIYMTLGYLFGMTDLPAMYIFNESFTIFEKLIYIWVKNPTLITEFIPYTNMLVTNMEFIMSINVHEWNLFSKLVYFNNEELDRFNLLMKDSVKYNYKVLIYLIKIKQDFLITQPSDLSEDKELEKAYVKALMETEL